MYLICFNNLKFLSLSAPNENNLNNKFFNNLHYLKFIRFVAEAGARAGAVPSKRAGAAKMVRSATLL